MFRVATSGPLIKSQGSKNGYPFTKGNFRLIYVGIRVGGVVGARGARGWWTEMLVNNIPMGPDICEGEQDGNFAGHGVDGILFGDRSESQKNDIGWLWASQLGAISHRRLAHLATAIENSTFTSSAIC